MNVAIVGAGIIGAATAHELARQGHRVTVFERHGSVGEEASFSTAGFLGDALTTPWAAPGIGPKLRSQIWGEMSSLRSGHAGWPWLLRWRRKGGHADSHKTWRALAELAQYSSKHMNESVWKDETFEGETSQGRLVLWRNEQDQAQWQTPMALLQELGLPAIALNAEQVRQIEPGLAPEATLVGGLHLPRSQAGNCRLYAQMLRYEAEAMGVQFRFHTAVQNISHAPVGVRLEGSIHIQPFDAVVLCSGMATGALLQPLGMKLPLQALHGYTISALLRDALHAPVCSVVDGQRQVTITRMGQRIRVTGGAELNGAGRAPDSAIINQLYDSLRHWFPGSAHLNNGVLVWRGARPMLPDGAPAIGASRFPGIWLNTGHGAHGWSTATGSARLLTDLLTGRAPEVAAEAFTAQRF